MLGSSPLARGTFRELAHRTPFLRLIPARAGNILARHKTPCTKSAHPRSRGEHFGFVYLAGETVGSSPLARGTCLLRNLNQSNRLAHPRSRGEHGQTARRIPQHLGSSPLARGTSDYLFPGPDYRRLIPARAGNINSLIGLGADLAAHPRSRGEHSASTAILSPALSAHPRSRGEHVPVTFAPERAFGSSPLARGTCEDIHHRGKRLRLIPARAGNIA